MEKCPLDARSCSTHAVTACTYRAHSGCSVAACTFVDAVFWNVDIHSRLYGSTLDVLQLLHCFLAHVLQLADMIVHIGNLNFACRPCAPGCYLATHTIYTRLSRCFAPYRLQGNHQFDILRKVKSQDVFGDFVVSCVSCLRDVCAFSTGCSLCSSNMEIWTKLVAAGLDFWISQVVL